MSDILILTSKPFSSREDFVFDQCLSQAGLRRKDVTLEDVSRAGGELQRCIQRVRPNVVLCLGDEAAQSVLPEWPERSMQERRGYWWVTDCGTKVIGTYEVGQVVKSNAITRMLFTYDIQRAKEDSHTRELQRPTRKVEIVDTDSKAKTAFKYLRKSGYAACDIEIWDEQNLQCIGFADKGSRAFVFVGAQMEAAYSILRSRQVKLLFHNGAFDTYFMKTRCGVDTKDYVDDTIVRFHCCWPELAGQGESKAKRTQKSLRFLSSLYTKDSWWKDYSDDEAEMYYLNGLDCMVTYDVEMELRKVMKEIEIPPEIYAHEMSLGPALNAILERGLSVDLPKLDNIVEQLEGKQEGLTKRIVELSQPLIEADREAVEKPHLFWKKITCKGCRNGSKKKLTCEVCEGVGQWTEFEFNPGSGAQKIDLLYNVLGCPPRYEGGKLTVLEDKLKDILGVL